MSPTQILSEEHKHILKVIDVLMAECRAIEAGKDINRALFKKIIRFIKNYADAFHHAKEEDILFVELCKDNVRMPCNPVQQMLYEHDQGRAFVKDLEVGVKSGNRKKILESARAYADLLTEHIYKEDNILYPMADSALSQKVKSAMAKKFKRVESKFKSASDYILFAKSLQNRK